MSAIFFWIRDDLYLLEYKGSSEKRSETFNTRQRENCRRAATASGNDNNIDYDIDDDDNNNDNDINDDDNINDDDIDDDDNINDDDDKWQMTNDNDIDSDSDNWSSGQLGNVSRLRMRIWLESIALYLLQWQMKL